MKSSDYEISMYTSNDIDGVARVSRFLWSNDEESNRRYFLWKHQENPLLKKPMVVLARYADEVVGFYAHIPVEWKIREKNIMVLLGCDIVVHPEHQGKGLSTALDSFAVLHLFAKLNLTHSNSSIALKIK